MADDGERKTGDAGGSSSGADSSEERTSSSAVEGTDESEREQARGGSGEPSVPDSETAAAGAEQAGEEVSDTDDQGPGSAEGTAHPGVHRTAAVQVPEAHEVGLDEDFRAEVDEIMARYPQKRSASIPVLFAVQRRHGWCSPAGIREGAAAMGVTAAYLESVASFYDLFHMEPAGRHRVLVCTNISCWMRGGDDLLRSFCEASGADFEDADHGGILNADGDIFVSGFECLGACDLAPMASIDERYYGPLERDDAAAAIAALRAGGDVLPERQMATRPAAGGPDGEPEPGVPVAD